jgi:MraZ protein
MNSFHGEFEATVDAKGRFLLPAALRKQLPEGENTMVISRGFENCITLYPMATWNGILEKIKQLNQFDLNVRAFTRTFLGGASEIELDTAGRILLSNTMKTYAGISKDIVIAATLDRFEIWDAGKYNQIFENLSSKGFSDLAQQVMGNI